jgi:succinate-semialdehyde dehydrogenase/glutarate-semialdehyde dehydrogenase
MINLKDSSLFRTENYIDGQWRGGNAGQLEVLNPANGEPIAHVANGDADDASQAVLAAAQAFKSWSRTPAKQRAEILRRWYELILEHADDLGALMTYEQGKPLAEAIGEVKYGAGFVEFYAEECKRVMGAVIPTVAGDRRLQTYKQPVGVVGCVTPWNFPNAMITRKAAPAMAAGCTVVLKPDPGTPLSALALCELAERAGIPAGVLNVVVGSNSQAIGEVLTQDSRVAKFTFTGSTAVGKLLMAQCASTVKKVSFELGGNAPFILFDDGDIDEAVTHCIGTKFRNGGQTCVCSNRIFVQEKVAENFTEKLQSAIGALVVGDGFTQGVQIGPLINQQAVEKMDMLMTDAKEKRRASKTRWWQARARPKFLSTYLTKLYQR